jgi:hypothetical protein
MTEIPPEILEEFEGDRQQRLDEAAQLLADLRKAENKDLSAIKEIIGHLGIGEIDYE